MGVWGPPRAGQGGGAGGAISKPSSRRSGSSPASSVWELALSVPVTTDGHPAIQTPSLCLVVHGVKIPEGLQVRGLA